MDDLMDALGDDTPEVTLDSVNGSPYRQDMDIDAHFGKPSPLLRDSSGGSSPAGLRRDTSELGGKLIYLPVLSHNGGLVGDILKLSAMTESYFNPRRLPERLKPRNKIEHPAFEMASDDEAAFYSKSRVKKYNSRDQYIVHVARPRPGTYRLPSLRMRGETEWRDEEELNCFEDRPSETSQFSAIHQQAWERDIVWV